MAMENAENYYIRVLLKKLKLKDIMSKNVYSVHVCSPFSDVEHLMRVHKVRHVPVVKDGNKLIGIISQRDLFRTVSPKVDNDGKLFYDKETLDSYMLPNVMTKNPFCLKFEDSLEVAVLKMAETKYGCVPIVDDNNVLVGIITQFDIIKSCADILREK